MQNDRENDTMRENESRQVQQELEEQLRAFGNIMSDAFAHGFEGRGMDIGDRAYDVGRAAVHAANYGIGEAARAFRAGTEEVRRQRWQEKLASDWARQDRKAGYAGADASGMPTWLRQAFGGKAKLTPVEEVRMSAKKRHDSGCALLAVGITFTVIFGLAGMGCIIAAAMAEPAMVGETIEIAGAEAVDVLLGAGSVNLTVTILEIVGNALNIAACGFIAMIVAGAKRLSASKKLRLFADMAEGFDYKNGLSVEMLSELIHQKKAKTLKMLQKYIHKGWLNAWLDEKNQILYLTAEDYRAAQRQVPAPEPVQHEPEEKNGEVPLNLETARRFAAVLTKEKQLMQDEQARDELEHMQKTTAAICDWLEAHPESLPKARKFAEYYIPTTLKLLHTYNDVQGQQGANAESIRRDIAGILHTLNQAYDNLYNNLLDDVAMDVSSEIAALEGMLANDGLTGRDFQ